MDGMQASVAGARSRGRAGVGGVAAGPLHQPGIGEDGPRGRVQRAQRIDRGQVPRRAHATQQRETAAHRPGEERAPADVPDAGAAGLEAPVGRAAAGAEPLDGRGRGLGAVARVERRSVRPAVVELRVQPAQRRPRRTSRCRRTRNSSSKTDGQRQQRRAGIEAEALPLDDGQLAADLGPPFEDRHVRGRPPAGGWRRPARPPLHRRRRPQPRAQARRTASAATGSMAAPPTAATRRSRKNSAKPSVSMTAIQPYTPTRAPVGVARPRRWDEPLQRRPSTRRR